MRPEAEARPADFRRERLALSAFQTTSAIRRVLAPRSCVDRHTEKPHARREKCVTFVNDCKAVYILENVAGRNDEDTTTHCFVFKKVDTTTSDHSDDGMER